MVQTITPVVHGGRRAGWAGTLTLHVLGATVSALALGLALGSAGLLLGAPWGPAGAVVVAAVAGAYALRELAGLRVGVPDLRRQVPEWWRAWYSPRVAAALYGLGLGVGFVTHLGHGTLVAVAAVAVATGHPGLGALVVAPFGLARSLAVAAAWSATDGPSETRLGQSLERWGRSALPRLLNGAVLAAVALAALGAAGSSPRGPATALPAAVLTAAFAWAAVAKLLRFGRWRDAVGAYVLPAALERVAVIGVPVAEIAVPASIVGGAIRAGAGLALALLVAFSVAVARARRASGDRLPCGCFGGRATRDVRLTLARNAVLGALAAVALTGPVRLEVTPPGASEWLPAGLAAAGIALGAVALRRTAAALREGPREVGRAGALDGRS
jgi:methylamine utilization protein MauE